MSGQIRSGNPGKPRLTNEFWSLSTSWSLREHCTSITAPLSPAERKRSSATARTVLTVSAVSVALTIAGCSYSSTEPELEAYRAAVDHPRVRSQALTSASEHHRQATVKGRQPQPAPQPAPDCALRPYPDVCRFSPPQAGKT